MAASGTMKSHDRSLIYFGAWQGWKLHHYPMMVRETIVDVYCEMSRCMKQDDCPSLVELAGVQNLAGQAITPKQVLEAMRAFASSCGHECMNHRVVLVKTKDAGEDAWYYVLLTGSLLAFQTAWDHGPMDLAKHGEILYSGYGKDPPQHIEWRIMRRFQPDMVYSELAFSCSQCKIKKCNWLMLAFL